MQRAAILTAVQALLILAVMSAPAVLAVDASTYVVGFWNSPTVTTGSAFHGGIVRKVNQVINYATVETTNANFLAEAAADGTVRYVEKSEPKRFPAPQGGSPQAGNPNEGYIPNDPLFNLQYGLTQIRAPQAWEVSFGGPAAAVCLVDSGVLYTHQDIAGSRWLGGYDVGEGDPDPSDNQGHGTFVTSVAGATIDNGQGIAGVARVGIYGVKITTVTAEFTPDTVADGILWCAQNAGRQTVVSLSLGWPSATHYYQVVKDAMNYSRSLAGQVIVAAAGNNGPFCYDSGCTDFPAIEPEATSVSATTVGAQFWLKSSGGAIDLAAPGDAIVGASHVGDTLYRVDSGTSFSAPHVSGAAALLWSLYPDLTNIQIEERLRATSQDLDPPGPDVRFGWGELDVYCLIENISPCQ